MSAPGGLSGIDVSHIQGAVDWPAVAGSGVAYAFVRAGESDWAEGDLAFRRNVDGARAAGIVAGAYHVFHADKDPRKQADLFHARFGDFRAGFDMPPVIDFEWIGGLGCTVQSVRACEQFATEIHARFGVAPIIYTAAGYVAGYVAKGSALAALDLWLASYSPRPILPPAWSAYTFWQWVGNGGHCAGVGTDCDRNVFAGDRAAFDRWLAISGGRMGPAEPPHGDTIEAPLWLATQAKTTEH